MSRFFYDTFHVHRDDLEQRRKRCSAVVAEIENLGFELSQACCVCNSDTRIIVATEDRYGVSNRTAMCNRCGLFYQMDALTSDGFNTFYEKYYRLIEKLYTGEPVDSTRHLPAYIRASQEAHASYLIRVLRGQLQLGSNSTVLDVGGNIGVIARRFSEHYGCRVVVVDPAAPEVEIAQNEGVEAHVATVEHWQTDEQFDFVMILRAVEHLYDLRATFEKVRQLLKPNGLLYFDYVDLSLLTRYVGPIHAVVKLDHKYWLSRQTVTTILRHFGYEIVYSHIIPSYDGMGLLVRPTQDVPEAPADYSDKLDNLIQTIQEQHIYWDQVSNRPNSLQWMRAEARRLRHFFRSR